MSNMRKQGKKVSQTNLDKIQWQHGEEMSEREFRMYIVKIVREANDEIREQMQALNDHTNQQLKDQMQEAKDHVNKEREILKRNKQKFLK